MKLSDHVDHLRNLIEAAFDKQFARLGIGKAKLLEADKLPAEVREKRERYERILENHIGETGDYQHAREKLIDELTFTLFNRLAAIKVMEAANLFPPVLTKLAEHGGRSFGHKAWLEQHPEIREAELEGIRDYLKSAFDELGETLALYHKTYPYALLPDAISLNEIIDAFNAVEKDSQVGCDIWQSDDVLGWLYESYNDKKKQAHKDSKAKIEYDKVSLRSQTYTPRWVVQFLVENSLGKLYLEMYPDSEIKDRYKIANVPQIQQREPKPLPEIKLIDPACGSGNFLLYAFDFFYALYEDQIENYGADFELHEIPKLIIEHNLHGIDLDDRAVQLAQLGLYIKAKRRRRSLEILQFQVVSSDFYLPDYVEVQPIFEATEQSLNEEQKELMATIWHDLQYAYKFGSLIQLSQKLKSRISTLIENRYNVVEQKKRGKQGTTVYHMDLFKEQEIRKEHEFTESFWDTLKSSVEQYAQTGKNRFLASKTRDAITFLELLTTEYDVATANPPYTDSADFGPELKEFIEDNYKKPDKFHTNLYATFIKRCYDFTGKAGFVAMLHPLTFMYIKTFEDVRKFILTKTNINLLAELGLGGVFANSDVQVDVVMYILEKMESKADGTYFDLKKYKNHTNKPDIFRKIYENYVSGISDEHVFSIPQSKLKIVKSWPFIYWISDDFREKFGGEALGDKNKALTGLMTGNNNRYLRFFWEVNPANLSEHYPSDNKRWVGYQKGGPFVRWYGNNWIVVDFENNGSKLATTDNKEFYFKEGISYSASGSKGVSFRFIESRYSFDKGGPCIFNVQKKMTDEYLLGVMNSKLCGYIVNCLNPTVNRQVGDIRRIPLAIPSSTQDQGVSALAKANVLIKKMLCKFSLVELQFSKSPFALFTQGELKNRLDLFFNYENHLLSQVLINEAIINEKIFEVYNLTEHDKAMVLAKEGESIGGFPVSPDARNAYLDEIEATKDFPLNAIRNFIVSLPSREFSAEEHEMIKSGFLTLYQGNNTLEEFCIRHQVNPINVWYWFKQSNVIPQQRMHTLAMEFLADIIREILMEDEDGIIPLVPNAGEKVLLDRIEEKFREKGFSSAQYSSFDSALGRPIHEYLNKYFFAELSDHLKLFKQLPSTPFIWHLTSGPEQGFDCYIIIYKWSRDKLMRLRSVYIEHRERSLVNRQTDLSGNESADAQNEKDRIFRQLKEIEAFKKKIDELLAEGYNPILDDGVGKNIAPLQKKKMIPYEVLNAGQLKKYLNADW